MKEYVRYLIRLTWRRLFLLINYIPKRIRVVSATFLVTFLFFLTTFLPFQSSWYWVIPLLLICAYISIYFAVFEGIDGVELYMLFSPSLMLIIALYLFYFLLPVRWLTRLPLTILFGFLYYATLLTANIFNIGVEKSLPLFRAASSVNYFIQTCIIFLFSLVILTARQYFYFNGITIALVSLPIVIQLFWTVDPKAEYDRHIGWYGLVVSIVMLQSSILLAFLPIKPNIAALMYTTIFYCLSGIFSQHLDQRLFPNVVREYVFVFLFVVVILLFSLQW